jgi:hypothetical protein
MKRQKIESKAATAGARNAGSTIPHHTVHDAQVKDREETVRIGAPSSSFSFSSSSSCATGARDPHTQGVTGGSKGGGGSGSQTGRKGVAELRCRMSALSVEVFCASGTKAAGVSERERESNCM